MDGWISIATLAMLKGLAIISFLFVIAVGKVWVVFFLIFSTSFLGLQSFLETIQYIFCIFWILSGLPFLLGSFNVKNFDWNWFLMGIDFCKCEVIKCQGENQIFPESFSLTS